MDELNSKTSLYDFYEKHNVIIGTGTETIEAIMPNPQIRKELFMEKEESIFLRQRITYSGQAVNMGLLKTCFSSVCDRQH